MRTRTIVAIAAVLVSTGAVAMACGSSEEENPGTTCDPNTQVCDDTGGGESGGETVDPDAGEDSTIIVDTNLSDVPGDGVFIPPDGFVPCLDGGFVCGPDGAVIPLPDGAVTACVPSGTQCTDCADNDGDGLVDWMDPECTGPLDRDESSFATGIPGDNKDACKQDCWFDGNSGSGDDGCLFPGECLVGSTDKNCPYDPKAAMDPSKCPPPSKMCQDYCKKFVPKGCDCAGCCDIYTTFPDGGTTVHTVKLVDTCTTEALGDPTKCPPCAKIADCSNPCGKCEWCLGKTSLPPECFPPPPPPDAGPDAPPPDTSTTDTGMPPPPPMCPVPETTGVACSPTIPCPLGQYCLTGCCIRPPM